MSNSNIKLAYATDSKPPRPGPEHEIVAHWKEDATTPVVSIICTTFQHAPYINDALNGFLMQETDFPFEIVVHDDASTDGTAEIISKYAEKYRNIVRPVLQKQNQFSQGKHPSYLTFNRSLGKYLAFCEGDDYWIDPQKLSKQCKLMDHHQTVNICIHPGLQFSEHSKTASKIGYHGDTAEVKSLAEMLVQPGQFCPTASIVVRKAAALNMPEWYFSSSDLPYGDFFIEAILGVDGMLYMPDVMSLYRCGLPGSHTDRTAKRNQSELVRDYDATIRSISRLFEIPRMPTDALETRLSIIKMNYAFRFMALSDYDGFRYVLESWPTMNVTLKARILKASAKSRPSFNILKACLDYKRAVTSRSVN